MAALDDVWDSKSSKSPNNKKDDLELDCPSCGKRTWECITFNWYKCKSCLFYLTSHENKDFHNLLEERGNEAARKEQIRRRASAKEIPDLPCPNCEGILWVLYRDGGSHRCFDCQYWINAGDERLEALYGPSPLRRKK